MKEIAKTRASIRKKHRALKTGKIEGEIALERQFKPIVEPLKRIAERAERAESDDAKGDVIVKRKREDSGDDYGDGDGEFSPEAVSKLKEAVPKFKEWKRANVTSTTPIARSTPLEPRRLTPFLRREDIFESASDVPPLSPLEASVRETLETPQGRDALLGPLGPLGRRYVGALLGGNREDKIDTVYGVYLGNDGTMLGDKRFDLNADDSLIVDGVRYVGTPGLYELIFMRFPDEAIYTDDDTRTYKSILLATNAHRRGHSAQMPIMGNKGYKYVHVIAPLVRGNKKGAGVPSTMRLTDNKIDYVHWDDPNELVDRLRLLDASRRAGNDSHDNEAVSIIEELREAGLIIN